MAEKDPVSVETTKTPPPDKKPDGTPAPPAADVQAELERVRAALKSANKEAADRRKKLEAFEKAEEEREQAKLTELEKVQAELRTAQDRAAAIEQDALAAKISHAVQLAATKANFHDPEDAMAFLDVGEFTFDDKGKVEGVTEALDALAKARPYLVKSAQQTTDPDARKRNTSPKDVTDSDQATINARYGIRDRGLVT